MEIKEYARPADIASAYALLMQGKTNQVLGGCTFLKRTRKNIGTAIDLTDCGLSYIRETEAQVEMGAYTSLRDIETSSVILDNFGPALRETLEHLIGVQLRNAITIGGHVYGRYGFSDIIPTLLALDARIRLHAEGEMSLWSFLQKERKGKDILIEVIIPKKGQKTKVQMMRGSFNDYSIFCLAASRNEQHRWIVAAGAFPGSAKLAIGAMERMNRIGVTRDMSTDLAEEITEGFVFGSNYRASAVYRKELCRVFARRALEELADENQADGKP